MEDVEQVEVGVDGVGTLDVKDDREALPGDGSTDRRDIGAEA